MMKCWTKARWTPSRANFQSEMPCLISESLDCFALCCYSFWMLWLESVRPLKTTYSCLLTTQQMWTGALRRYIISVFLGPFQSVVTFVCSSLIHISLLLKQIVKSYDMPLESPGNYLVMFLLAFMTVQQIHNALKKNKGDKCYSHPLSYVDC